MARRILITLAAGLCIAFVDAFAAEKPVVFGPVRNGASFEGSTPTLRGGSGLAGGSIFVLFGAGLGPGETELGGIPYPDQLPAEAGGTRVTFRSLENEQVYSAPLIHSLQSQVSGIVPSLLPVGMAEVTVSYDGLESEPTKVAIVEFSPGLFTVSQTGRGPAVVQNYESAVAQPLNTLTHPAAPGQYLILWGTGLGPVDGPDNMAPAAGNVRDDVSIEIGGVEVPAEYAGRSPEFPGVDQINVRIPDDGSITLGCYQDLGIQIGNHGFGTRTSISISDTPGECDHPWGLSAQKLAELEDGGTASFLHLLVSQEFTYARAAKANALGVSQNASLSRQISSPFPDNLVPGNSSCIQASIFEAPPIPPSATPRPLPPGESSLDLGSSLQLNGPGGRELALPKSETLLTWFGLVSDVDDDLFVPGDWTLNADGGVDTPAFQAAFSIAPLPQGVLPETVNVGDNLEIVWDGSAYQEGDRIEIRLQQDPETPSPSGAKALLCSVAATKGTLRVTTGNFAWIEASPGTPLRWRISVEGALQDFVAEGIDHGQISALAFEELAATVAE